MKKEEKGVCVRVRKVCACVCLLSRHKKKKLSDHNFVPDTNGFCLTVDLLQKHRHFHQIAAFIQTSNDFRNDCHNTLALIQMILRSATVTQSAHRTSFAGQLSAV